MPGVLAFNHQSLIPGFVILILLICLLIMASDSEPDAIAAMENDDKASTSKPKSVSQAQTLAQPFQATDADFTLVSSDGASFKIHRYHLLAARSVTSSKFTPLAHDSTVIRELLDLENGHGATTPEPAMTFVDPVTETAGSLSIFLSLVYGTDLFKPQHRFVVPCIAFLRTYDCQPALHSLRTLVRAQLVVADHSGMNPYRIFQAAAQLDDHITCSEAIRRGGHQHWNRKSECRGERGVHQFLPNRSIFHPATMGVKDMEVIPPT